MIRTESLLLLQDLNLTSESFTSANLMATIESIEAAMANGNAAYAEAISVNGGWTFNLLITSVSVMKEYNGLLILPVLSAVSQIVMTKVTGGQQPQGNDQSAQTGKFLMWFFPIFSLVICVGYSSAFALYWVAGNVFMMGQTLLINKMLDEKEKKAALAGEGTVK